MTLYLPNSLKKVASWREIIKMNLFYYFSFIIFKANLETRKECLQQTYKCLYGNKMTLDRP